jgi:predicted nucleic acid-binding protein
VSLSVEIGNIESIFIDTAPLIYYIEAHPQYGPLVREVVNAFQAKKVTAFTSVITLTEVLPKPIESGNMELAGQFADFLKFGGNITLIEISENIADKAGRLRGKYPALRTIDAIQIATAVYVGADVFLTNDKKLKKIREIKVTVLDDYL